MAVGMKNHNQQVATSPSAEIADYKLYPGRQYWIQGAEDFFYKTATSNPTAVADADDSPRCYAKIPYPITVTGDPDTAYEIAILSDGTDGHVDIWEEAHS